MLIRADARHIPLRDASIHCCVTSPPYWGLRDYGTGSWEGGDPECQHRVGGQVQDSKAPGAITTGQRPGVDSSRCKMCGARRIDAQIGCEPTPDEFVANMARVFREVHRVLRHDGTLWVNLGDSYAADRGGSAMPAETLAGGESGIGDEAAHRGRNGRVPRRDCKRYGLKHKDLVGIPWRVAFALQGFALVPIDEIARLCRAIDSQDLPALQAFRAGFRLWEELSDMGWFWHRSDIIWSKDNPMPESVTDRPTKAHEYIFMLAKSDRYFYDQTAVREAAAEPDRQRSDVVGGASGHMVRHSVGAGMGGSETKNRRSVWNINTQPFDWDACKACRRTYTRDESAGLRVETIDENGVERKIRYCRCGRSDAWLSHFAAFPDDIPKLAILAGTSAVGACAACGAPVGRVVEKEPVPDNVKAAFEAGRRIAGEDHGRSNPSSTSKPKHVRAVIRESWEPTCGCSAGTVPCRVLDPFCGAGTTVKVARELGREGIGLDYSMDYLQLLASRRIIVTMGLGI